MNGDRLPPHDVEAEEAAIASLLLDPEAIFKVAPFLHPEDFFREKNRWAYEACFSLYERREPINQITLAHELASHDRLEAVGGAAYFSQIIASVPTSIHVEHYAQIVHRTALLRRLIDAAGRIAALGYEGGPDVDAVLDRAEDVLFRLRRGQSPRDFVHIREVLDQYLEDASAAHPALDGSIPHANTGFTDLDQILGGLQRSNLILLAARPSLGKTSLALNIAHHAALHQRARVAVFSLEMAKEELVQRLLASETGVDSRRLRLGLQNEEEERRIIEATGVLSEFDIYIDDSPLIGAVEMRSKARRLHYERGLDLIIIDYLQLVQGADTGENRVQQMSEITRSLKLLARELDVPVLACSQLSRATELRSPPIPHLADLRDSGSLEQDADVVLFIYREDLSYTPEEWERRNPTRPYPRGIANIIVAKHRNGPTGQVSLLFREATVSFVNLATQEPPTP